MSRRILSWSGLAALLLAAVPALSAPPVTTVREPTALVGPQLRATHLELSEPLQDNLRRGQWSQAARLLERIDPNALEGSKRSAWAFLLCWSLIHADRALDAVPYLPLVQAGSVPKAYASLLHGEVDRARGQAATALEHLRAVPTDSAIASRARVQEAEVLRELGRTEEAFAIYTALAERADPAPGNPEALLALAQRSGVGSDVAYAHLRRVWWGYPRSASSRAAAKLLESYKLAAHRPTWQEVGKRAEQLMGQSGWQKILDETAPHLASVSGDGVDACRFLFSRGRAFYKKNQLSNSARALAGVAERCKNAEGTYGARAAYLLGKAQYRRKNYALSAAAFTSIPALYPSLSYADDGYTEGGISLQQAGDLDGARELWRKALADFPEGDTAPEATWRLAWSLYLAGRTDEAIEVADRLGALPLVLDRRHVEGGRYWSARWRLYPDVEHPTVAVLDAGRRDEAVQRWRALCQDLPHSFFSVLAYSRLVEVAPEVAKALDARATEHRSGEAQRPWAVRLTWLSGEHSRTGLDLARLGLIREAKAEWRLAGTSTFTAPEMALVTEMRVATGDWLMAHDAFGRWLKHHPPGTLGEQQPEVLRVAYPDRYWDEVRAATQSRRLEARYFHALVREESNFNRRIVSFAGARGLSQLMPATARQTAGWLGMSIQMSDLDDPKTNLTIGAKYLEVVQKQLHGSPYLALAGYNAGPHRVEQWWAKWGSVPTDEFVERIPFEETRGYVKRVTGTWQTYRYQFDGGTAFPDLSRFNHVALP